VRRLAVLLAASLWLPSPPAFAGGPVSYRPPVDGPIVDTWRPPAEQWSAGNRGIDYAPGSGARVRAAADGEVVFAGQVGGDLHVVVLHADGIRTSYSFLQSIAVHRGDHVAQGDQVGTSGDDLHFGARVGDTYVDPRTLFDDGPPEVFLVPDEARRPDSEAEERAGLGRFLAKLGEGALHAAASMPDGAAWAGQQVKGAGGDVVDAGRQAITSGAANTLADVRGAVHYGTQLDPSVHASRLARTALDWYRQRSNCTPADVPPPPLPERRIAVAVAGLGSSSGKDSIDQLDTTALGYAPRDVMRFSYRGGSTDASPYGPADTTVDLRTSAHRLGELLEQVRREHPGVPVDLLAHSQGGMVARTFLAYEYDANDPRLPRIANLVTLASPHQGADIATALDMVSHTMVGDAAEWGLSAAGASPFDLRGESVRQLSETSAFLRKLNDRPLPADVRVTSIGARGDATVPAVHTRLPGAHNVVVSVPGMATDHSGLPGSEAARREVALAVAGRPPTCQSLGDMLTDTATSDAISTAEDAAGAAAWLGARRLDSGLQEASRPAKLPSRRDP
jgi:murein DD-endopeptidase MepM/ murein hydrolase activator NlpD